MKCYMYSVTAETVPSSLQDLSLKNRFSMKINEQSAQICERTIAVAQRTLLLN